MSPRSAGQDQPSLEIDSSGVGAGHMVTSSTRRQQICKVILQPGGLHGGRGLSGPHEKLIGQLPFKEVSADAAHILPAPAKSTGILPGGQT